MPELLPLPVVIEPFSTFGDEIAGATPDEVALNLAAATRTSLAWRCKPRRPLPDVWTLFAGHQLTYEARQALRDVVAEYTRLPVHQRAATAVLLTGAPVGELTQPTLF